MGGGDVRTWLAEGEGQACNFQVKWGGESIKAETLFHTISHFLTPPSHSRPDNPNGATGRHGQQLLDTHPVPHHPTLIHTAITLTS